VFTGIVEAVAPVRAFDRTGEGARLVLPGVFGPGTAAGAEVPALGDSIAVGGCCLTVAAFQPPPASAPAGTPDDLVFELSAETLALTWFADLAPGTPVNLERALRVGDRLGGHLVSGHVDGLGRILSIDGDREAGWAFRFEVPQALERYLIAKGSITIDGISLTVVRPKGREFEVAVIPATFDGTNLGRARAGQPVHLEADHVGKWVERLFPQQFEGLERGA
jgi:riboflavin synthase